MLVLERPWTRQPSRVVGIAPQYAGNILGYWLASNAGGMFLDQAAGRHIPLQGWEKSSVKGRVYAAARSRPLATSTSLPAVGSPSVSMPHMAAVWVKFDYSDILYDALFTTGAVTTPYARRFSLFGNHTNAGGLAYTTYGQDGRTSGGVFTVGEWVHLCLLYDGTQLIQNNTAGFFIYKNLVSQALTANTSATPVATYASVTSTPMYPGDASDAPGTYALRGDLHSLVYAQGSVAELRQIMRAHYQNPYTLLEPRSIYIPTSTAAATAPSITSLSARLITATSAQPRISYS